MTNEPEDKCRVEFEKWFHDSLYDEYDHPMSLMFLAWQAAREPRSDQPVPLDQACSDISVVDTAYGSDLQQELMRWCDKAILFRNAEDKTMGQLSMQLMDIFRKWMPSPEPVADGEISENECGEWCPNCGAHLKSPSKPVSVSLEKMSNTVAALYTNWETFTAQRPSPRETAKAVLDAANVRYVE